MYLPGFSITLISKIFSKAVKADLFTTGKKKKTAKKIVKGINP